MLRKLIFSESNDSKINKNLNILSILGTGKRTLKKMILEGNKINSKLNEYGDGDNAVLHEAALLPDSYKIFNYQEIFVNSNLWRYFQ